MIFCNKCFSDVQIKSLIKGLKQDGKCPTCGDENSYLYNTDINHDLEIYFNSLISCYTPQSSLPYWYERSNVSMLTDELLYKWNIFNKIPSEKVSEILRNVSNSLYNEVPELFNFPVGVPEKYDMDYLSEHSILRDNTWNKFIYSLKFENRFYTKMINENKLEIYLSYLRKDYLKGTIFFRGRLCNDGKKYLRKDMGAPPKEKASEGRANSYGISRLYLADSEETCIHEIRAGTFDSICIGRFRLNKSISVIDFKQTHNISIINDNFDYLEYLINKQTLLKINEEMGRAVRSSDDPLDYIPTQYLCDFIKTVEFEKNKKFSGVEYTSTLNSDGYNLAIFYPEFLKCTKINQYKIDGLRYDKSDITNNI